MVTPPKHRLEIVLMADQAAPVRFWAQSTAELAKRIEYDKEKSIRIVAGVALFLIIALYVFPAATVISFLMGIIVFLPANLVGMAGYSRGT
jgi:fatty acid desaturase